MKRAIFSFMFAILGALIFGHNAILEGAEETSVCPEYKNGDYWVFNAQHVDFTTNRSNALEGNDFKVVYSDARFELEGFPYSQNSLMQFFPCNGISELIKVPLYLGKLWVNKLDRNIDGKSMRLSSASEVIGSKQVKANGETFNAFIIRRVIEYSSPSYNREMVYFYISEIKSLVLFYQFSTKLPFASKIYLTATGSADSDKIRPFNVNTLFDPILDKRFLELYSKK